MRKIILVPAMLFATATFAAPALASDDADGMSKPKADWMSIQQLTDKLTNEGYKVRQIKSEKNGYEVYAIDKDGRRLEAYIDPVSGKLLGSESGEDD